jgi:hypothetical protein
LSEKFRSQKPEKFDFSGKIFDAKKTS